MTIGQVAQDRIGSEESVPRHGSIYDRLDKARAQRVKSLSPGVAANDEPLSNRKPRVPKSRLLPDIKPQEEFDPKTKQGLPAVVKLGLGVLAFAVMAGFSMLDWGTPNRAPNSDTPARIADAPSEPIVIEQRQDTQSLGAEP